MTEFRATYRLQLGGELDFAAAAELVPYLSDLGVSHLYLSPAFAAREGSTHGYDVIDPTRLADALGGEQGFRALAAAVQEAGMGIVLDIVPNHMATDDANPYWAGERRAQFFDLDSETGRHRRFFDVDHLAGVRQEDPEVFAETHRLALALVGEGLVDGLRVDHPDGLADPAGYLERLHDGGAGHIWVEKILDPGEQLRDWPVEGTVGYEFAIDACALFVDPAGEAALTELWIELCGDARPFAEWATEAKLEQARTVFAPDVAWLRRLWPGVEGLEEALAALPVYRTYIRDLPAREDLRVLREAGLTEWLAQAPRAVPRALPAAHAGDPGQGRRGHRVLPLRAAARAVRGRRRPEPLRDRRRCVSRRQRRPRRALPAPPALQPDPRHEALGRCARADRRARRHGGGLDRGGARLARAVRAAACRAARPMPSRSTRSSRRSWAPGRSSPSGLRVHVQGAARGQAQHELGRARRRLGAARAHLLPRALRARRVPAAFEPFAERVAAAGELHALRQTALKLTVPGVPDIYQGDELVALALVDPDNRRPVDWARRRELLAAARDGGAPEGRTDASCWLIRELLALRARRPDAFAGGYTALAAGADAVAFLRGDDVAVALPIRGAAPAVELPAGDWRPAFDPDLLPGAGITVLERHS